MRFIGLDIGTKTIGISISDKTNMIATPLKTIFLKEKDYEKAIEEILAIMKEKEITDVVIGLPKNMDNSYGFAAQRTLEFKELFEKKGDYPIHLVDERLSTVEAEKILIASNNSRKKRKKVIDNVAGAIILDTYLKERRIKDERQRNQ